MLYCILLACNRRGNVCLITMRMYIVSLCSQKAESDGVAIYASGREVDMCNYYYYVPCTPLCFVYILYTNEHYRGSIYNYSGEVMICMSNSLLLMMKLYVVER